MCDYNISVTIPASHLFILFYLPIYLQAELWFHDNQGLTQKRLEELWCRYTGSLQAGLTFNQFGDLYNEVVEFKYQA